MLRCVQTEQRSTLVSLPFLGRGLLYQRSSLGVSVNFCKGPVIGTVIWVVKASISELWDSTVLSIACHAQHLNLKIWGPLLCKQYVLNLNSPQSLDLFYYWFWSPGYKTFAAYHLKRIWLTLKEQHMFKETFSSPKHMNTEKGYVFKICYGPAKHRPWHLKQEKLEGWKVLDLK